MARGRNSEPTLRERITRLETNWPHLESAVDRTAREARLIRQQVQNLQRYVKAGVTLGAAALIHFSSGQYAETIAGVVKVLLGFIA